MKDDQVLRLPARVWGLSSCGRSKTPCRRRLPLMISGWWWRSCGESRVYCCSRDSMTQWAGRTVRKYSAAIVVSMLVCQLVSVAQDPISDIPSGKIAPSITMSGPANTMIPRGKAGAVQLRFHIGSGFHINSNKPKSEFLIPTVLKLDAPTDIVIGRVMYPPGQEMSFA